MTNAKFNFINNLTSPFGSHEIKHISKGLIKLMQGFIRVNPQYNVAKKAAATTSSTSNTASTTTSTSTDSPPSNDEAPQYIGGRIEILLDIYDLLAVKINELISIASTDEDVVINILQGIKQYPLDDIRLRHVIHALAKYGLGLDRITHERIVDSLLQFVVASLPKYTIEHEEIHAFFFLLAKLLRLAYEHVVIPLLMKNPSEAKYYLQFRAKKYGFESTEIRYALRNLSSSSNAIRSFVVALIPWMKYSILDDEHTEQCIVSSSKMNADGDDDDNEKEKENPEKHQVNLKIEQVIKSYTGLCKIREGSKLQFASAFPNNTMDQLSILLAFESEMISLMQVPFVQFFDTKDILELDFNQRVQAKQNQSQSSYDILLDFGTQSPYVQASSSSHLLLDSTTATSSSSSGGNDSMEVAKTQVQSMMRHIVPLLHAISKCMSHHEEIDAITLFLLHQLNTILSKETSILDEDHIFYDDWYDEEQNHRDEDDEEDRKCQEIYYYKSMNSGDRDLTLYHISACFAKWLLYCELLYNAGKIQSWYSTASREFLKLICKKLTTLLPQIMNYLLHARKQDGRRLTEKVYHVYLRSIAMVTIALEKISIIGDDVRPVMDFIYNTLFDEFFTMIDFIREEYTLTTSILQVSTHILRGFQRAQYYYTLDSMMTSHKTVFMRLVSQYVKIVDHAFHPELAAAEEEQQQQQAAQNELPALPHTPHASGSNRLGAYAPPSEDFMQAINAKFHKPEPPKKKEIISIEQAIQLLMKFVQNLSFKQWISCAELYMTPLESHQTCTEGGFNSISMKLQENCQSYNEVIITALSEGSNPFVLLFSISEVVLSMATIFTVFAFNNLTSLSSLKEVEDKINIYAVVDLLRIQCQKLYLTYDSFFKQSTTIYQDILEVMRKGVPSRSAYHALLDDLKQWKLKRMKDKQTAKAIAAQNPGAPQISATDEKDMEDKIFGEQAINVLYNFRPHLYFLSVINDIFGLRYQTPVPTQYDEEGNEISPAEPIAGEEILYPFYVDTRNMLTVVLIFVLIDIDSISLTSTIKLMRVCRAILDFAHSLQQRISRDDFAFDRADIICFMMEDILKKSIHHLETLYMKFVQRNLLPNANNAMNSSITSLPNTSSGQPSDLIQELFTSEIRELYQESIFYLQHYYQIVYYSDPNYNQAYSALSGNYFQTEIDSLQVIHDSLFSMIYQVPQISTFEKLRYSKRQDCIMTRPKMTGVDGNAVSATSPWYHMMEQALLQVMKISLYEINAFAWNSLVSYVIVNSFPALIRLEFSKQTVTKELYAISEDVRIVQGMHCLTLYHDFFGRIMIFSKEIQEGYHRLKTAKGNTTDAVEILDDDDDVMENLGSAKNANKIISSSSSSSNSCSSSSIEEKLQLKAKKFLQTTAYHLLMDVIPSHEYQPSTIFNTVIDSERIAESFGIIHVVFIVDVDNFSVWGRTERQAADSQEALLERFFATALESMNMMTLRFLGLIP